MRHSKHNSSICETTTLLSMSNVSAHSETLSLPNSHHEQLAQKLQELTLILHTTLAEQALLTNRNEQLQVTLAERKAALQAMLNRPSLVEEYSSLEEQAQTCGASGRWGREESCEKTVKNHQKFYSAIQSPSLNRSSKRNYDQLTFHSYQKSRQPSNFSKGGLIRKQGRDHCSSREQLRERQVNRPPSYASPRQRDFESIEDIWNESERRKGEEKPASYKGIKSFL